MIAVDQESARATHRLVSKPGNFVRISEDGALCMAEVVSIDNEGCVTCLSGNKQLTVNIESVQPGWNVVGSSLNSHLDVQMGSSHNDSTAGALLHPASASSNSFMGLPHPSPGMFAQDTEGRIVLVRAL